MRIILRVFAAIIAICIPPSACYVSSIVYGYFGYAFPGCQPDMLAISVVFVIFAYIVIISTLNALYSLE